MMSEEQIHYMFYENGKRKDRNDPSQRVTKKLYWSKYFHTDTITSIEEKYGRKIHKMDGMPFIANLAYSGFGFIEAIEAWNEITNMTAINLQSDIIRRSKIELYAFVGYIDALKISIDNIDNMQMLVEPIFAFHEFKKFLMCAGIKFEDSKILSRANNLKRLISNSIKAKKFNKEKVKTELITQHTFLHSILKEICFSNDDDFAIYLLRYDLKKVS